MSSSANTFGTFLQTFSNLEKQGVTDDHVVVSTTVVKADVDALVRLVHDIAKKGDSSPLKELMASSPVSQEQFLSTILMAKEQGLLEIKDDQGESMASLTNFGRVFSMPK